MLSFMRIISLITLILLSSSITAQHMKTLDKITWFGQAAIKINHDGKNIYIDPYQMPEPDTASLVLITHSHQDHLSPEDLMLIATKNTPIICPESCEEQMRQEGYTNLITVKPGSKITVDGIKIEAVPMYNVVKTNYHPKENNWTGFILEIGNSRIYHAGDTERIPEMKQIDCDIVMLPLGQTYTMNSVEEAAEAALDTGAEIAIPIHYGMYEGTEEDAKKFSHLLQGKMEVVILERVK
jgi:L-ascorbate metabolism protein UlaG (beta-lactamase superfamily)